MVYLLPDVELNLFVRSEKLDNVRRGLAHKINLASVSRVIAGKALPSSMPAEDLGSVARLLQDFPMSEGLLDRGIRCYGLADCAGATVLRRYCAKNSPSPTRSNLPCCTSFSQRLLTWLMSTMLPFFSSSLLTLTTSLADPSARISTIIDTWLS